MDRVAKNPAVFDIDKLNWINAQYLRKVEPAQLLAMALPHLQEAGYVGETVSAEQEAWLTELVALLQEYISYAAQVVDHAAIFFGDAVTFENDEAQAVLADADVPQVMDCFRQKLEALETVDSAAVKAVLKAITKELKLGGKKVYMPLRVAITGQMHGPDLDRIVSLLGRERTLARIAGTLTQI